MSIKTVETLFKNEGFLEANHVTLSESISFGIYRAQVWDKNIGGMSFLEQHSPFKDPKKQKFKSAFVGLFPYYPLEDNLQSSLKVSIYAKEKDYHLRLSDKLENIQKQLELMFPQNIFSRAVDSSPVLERDLAYRAGLGWVGKNTCLLSKKHGSLFFIAEILTDLECQSKPSLKTDHCGTCTRCIDVCPTGALSPRKLDVEKCISYRNIEDKDCSPESLNQKIDSWFFGCDLCQTVCPWNEKAHSKEEMNELSSDFIVTEQSIEELKEILSKSNKQLMKDYSDFPLDRARGTGLKRNALKIIEENNIKELKDFLKSLKVSEQLEDLKQEVIKRLLC